MLVTLRRELHGSLQDQQKVASFNTSISHFVNQPKRLLNVASDAILLVLLYCEGISVDTLTH